MPFPVLAARPAIPMAATVDARKFSCVGLADSR